MTSGWTVRGRLMVAAILLSSICFAPPSFAQGDEAATLQAKLNELYQAGKYPDAIPIAQRLLAIRDATFGPDHPDVATILSDLAALYFNQRRYSEAEPLYRRLLPLRERTLGSDYLDVAETLNALAEIDYGQARFTDTEALLKRALAIREKALGSDHADVVAIVISLGTLNDRQARYAEAEPFYKRALAVREKTLGPDHPDVATALISLALLYASHSRFEEPEPLYKRALAIREKALGPDHSDLVLPLNYLADLYLSKGRDAETEALLKRALAISEKALGPDNPYTASSLNLLAELYRQQARYTDAESLFKRSLVIAEQAFGPDDVITAAPLNNLAVLYLHQSRYADAELLFKRAYAIVEKVHGSGHPDLARALINLASMHLLQGRADEAEPLLKRALPIFEEAVGPEHGGVAATLTGLVEVYATQSRHAEAEPFAKRALAIREKTLGPDHRDAARGLNALAGLYGHQARYADALPLAKRAIVAGQATPAVTLPILLGSQHTKLISAETAFDDALNVVQRAAQTSAASALRKLAVRFAAGSDRLAQLVRKDQDLAMEAETLDKTIIAAVSKASSERDGAVEQRIKARLAENVAERAALQKVFATEFPDYAALSNPVPLTAKGIRSLLSGDEALLMFAGTNTKESEVFAADKESYVFALTRDGFDWQAIPHGSDALAQKVAAFRRGLNVDALNASSASGKPELFDLGLAHELYGTLIGPVEAVIKAKKTLIVVPSGALTALPFHLLLTAKSDRDASATDPSVYRNADWLLKRSAVTVLPSVASLQALRAFARKDQGKLPMIGFADPVFGPEPSAASGARKTRVATRKLTTRAFTDFWQGAGVDREKLAQALPRLEDTADEIKAVALKLRATPKIFFCARTQPRPTSSKRSSPTTAWSTSPRMGWWRET